MRFLINLLFVFIFILACNKKVTKEESIPKTEMNFEWVKKPKIIPADSLFQISLKTFLEPENLSLCILNDYGTSIIAAERKNNLLVFSIPEHFASVSGILLYTLLYKETKLDSGEIEIAPLTETNLIETYSGPSYLVASTGQYSMLVVIPNDKYDNPNLVNYTYSELYRGRYKENQVKNNEIVNYSKIYSRTKKGKIFIKAFTPELKSKVKELTILSNNAVDFVLSYRRSSSFADGKELTTLYTSVIKDIYGNIIENGTLVSFYINAGGIERKAFGKTSNGIATCLILHPKQPISYSVKAFVESYAVSNTIKIKYTIPKY